MVALVVTIVVLLILAGISINLVLGDNGIVKKAQEASAKTKLSSAQEELTMIIAEYPMSPEYASLKEFLESKVPNAIDAITEVGDGKLEVEKDGYIATVNSNGEIEDFAKAGPRPVTSNIKVVANSDGTGENVGEKTTDEGTPLYVTFTHSIEGGTTKVSPSIPFKVTANGTYKFTVTGTVNGDTSTKTVSVTVNQYSSKYKIGDYVNYTYDTASNYVLTSATCGSSSNPTDGIPQTTGLKWRILNIDETNGTVDLISENPTGTNVYFQGALGYHNGPYLMNAICEAQYSNSTLNVKARNISLLDMEKQLTTAGIAARNAYNKGSSSYAQYGKTKTYTDSNSYYPLLYDGQKGAGVNVAETNASTIAQPDITKGNDPYEESVETTSPITDKTYKQADNKVLTVTQTYYYIPINEPNYGDAAKVLTSNNTYWVSGRFVDADSSIADFGLRIAYTNMYGYRMFYSNNFSGTIHSRLRPVVSLSSSILSDAKDASGAWNLK